MNPRRSTSPWIALTLAGLLLAGCGEGQDPQPKAGGPEEPPHEAPPPPHEDDGTNTLLDQVEYNAGIFLEAPDAEGVPDHVRQPLEQLVSALASAPPRGGLTIDYPLDGSVFPPEMIAPTFLWHDDTKSVDLWWFEFAFADGARRYALVSGPTPPLGEIDQEAMGPTNEIYQGTEYQQSARGWEPRDDVWSAIKDAAAVGEITLSITGFSHKYPESPRTRATIRFSFSEDEVGAPIFYRDVPLMPNEGKRGIITPLARSALPLIRWRIRNLERHDSRVVLRDMPTCANCHSFSLDGKTMGMDVDGPHGDKGTYLISPVEELMVVEKDEVISWNEFPDKPKDHKTIGFISRLSPNGRYALTTLNESLYVANFTDYKFLQVFYPTRGILAYYDAKTDEMKALPGADDPDYVHTNGVWSPDGETIVFSRAKAVDPYPEGRELAGYANDPNEIPIQYDLYRIPFNGGKGGKAVPIEGASANGMSNTFPKVSPDGKWIVYTKCKNGQLMRPDGRLWIVPYEGGEAREMECNTSLMNSWHSFSPNSRWMVFSSKVNTPYTQMFLTHIDENGNSTPPILVPHSTPANRAVNIPEFLNASYESIQDIQIPAVRHRQWYTAAIMKYAEGDLEGSLGLLAKTLDENPDFLRAHLVRGEILLKLGRRKEALPHYLSVIEEEPNNVSARLMAGGILERLGRADEAIEQFRRAMSAPGARGLGAGALNSLLLRRGLRLDAKGDVDGAVEAMRQAIEASPRSERAREELVGILSRAGRDHEAQAALRDLLALRPDDSSLMVRLAWGLATHPDESLRDPTEAVDLAEQAVALTKSKDAPALDALAAAYAATGAYEKAVEAAEKALTVFGLRKRLRRAIEARLELYRANQPYRDSPR